MNQATAFIDASTVYGFTEERSESLRTFVGGQLRMLKIGATQLLPPSTDPNDGCNTVEMNAKGRYCFESGTFYNRKKYPITNRIPYYTYLPKMPKIISFLNPT